MNTIEPAISLILPAYNEASRQEVPGGPMGDAFRSAVTGYLEHLSSGQYPSWELTVVDDGSRDGTADLAKELGATNVISYENNRGDGFASKTGILAANGLVRVVTDSDGSYGPEVVNDLFDTIEGGADVAAVYRAGESQHVSLIRQFGHSAIHRLCEVIAPTGVLDTQAGAKAFSAEASGLIWPKVTRERWSAPREALHIARSMGLNIEQIPATAIPVGGSRVSPIKDGTRMLADSLAIRHAHSPKHAA